MAIRLSLRSKRMCGMCGLELKWRAKMKKGRDFIPTVDYCCPYSEDYDFERLPF